MYKSYRWRDGVPAWQTDKGPLPQVKPTKSPALYRLNGNGNAVKRVTPGSVPDCLLVGFRLPETETATKKASQSKATDPSTASLLREELRKITAPKSGVRGGTALCH